MRGKENELVKSNVSILVLLEEGRKEAIKTNKKFQEWVFQSLFYWKKVVKFGGKK